MKFYNAYINQYLKLFNKAGATVWIDDQAPREKLIVSGAEALTDVELLAIFLRTGLPGVHVMALSEQLLHHFGSLYHVMMAEQRTFCAVKGMGVVKFVQFQAVAELARRLYATRLVKEKAMLNPDLTLRYLQSALAHQAREIFTVLFLDNQHRVIRHQEMFAGSIANRLKNDYILCPDMRQRSIAGCYQNNVAWLYDD